jgi:murein L,D-transpeptidase YcbB/YkuD
MLFAALALAVPAAPAMAAPPVSVAEDGVALALRQQAGGWMARVYGERGWRPLWARGGRIGPAAMLLLDALDTADRDGLKPRDTRKLRQTIDRAATPQEVAHAELALSDAFVAYVRDQRKPRNDRTEWADKKLKARRPDKDVVLRAAFFPKDFAAYVRDMGWMSPQYVHLRSLMPRAVDGEQRARLVRNLDRARLLPGPWTRHVLVDASSGRLWYYEAGRQVGTMRVVVGAKETQTPLLAGTLQWAILNPYWNVPTYLAKKSVAPKVLGGRSLASLRMEALSDWTPAARKIPASAVDWQAVAAGTREVRLRELPGAGNSMGRVKFLFPNDEGIYLHDTNERDLLKPADRHFSNGCIRLADAPALARWLMGKPLSVRGLPPEQAVALPVPVPVYLTYLTVSDDDKRLAFRADIYGRDS